MYAIKNAIETLGITGDPNKLSIEREEIAGYLYNSPVFQGVLLILPMGERSNGSAILPAANKE